MNEPYFREFHQEWIAARGIRWNFEGDPRFQRTGAILLTPNGYLVRYQAIEQIDVPSRAISSVDASVYFPHRAITPAMSKSDFAQRISAVR